jgi:chaperone required for assembly of F1-ATPase
MNDRPIPVAKPLPPLRVEAADGGFCVMAGDQPWKTPAGVPLTVPTRELGEAIAAEIAAARGAMKGGKLPIDEMGLTRLAATAIDRIAPKPSATARALLEYAETDLLCYRGEKDSDLRARQDDAWHPLLVWLGDKFNARLTVVEGIMPASQPELALVALSAELEKYDHFFLSGLGVAVQTAGSLVVGLALAHGRVDAAGASALADLDETYQNELWGTDEEAVAKRSLRASDLALAARFLLLIKKTGNGIQ